MGAKVEDIRVWQPAGRSGIELRRGRCVREPYPRHWHEEYQFCLATAGDGELRYRGESHYTGSGTLFIVHPGEIHSNRTEHDLGCSFRSLYLAPDLVRHAHGERALPFFKSPVVEDKLIVAEFSRLHLSLESGVYGLEQESMLISFLLQLKNRYGAGDLNCRSLTEPKPVQLAKQLLREKLDQTITLEDVAYEACMSPFHFHRLFSKHVGMPPHEYLTHLRVARAKALLRRGRPLAEVAAETGFCDQAHFTRQFKRLVKLPPGKYLRDLRSSA